jgi:integrase
MSTTRRAKRDNGEGTVFEDKERGGYIGQLWVDGKRRKVRGRTRVDVLAKLAVLRRQEADGTVVADGNATLGDLLDRWRDRELAARKMASTTRERYVWAIGLLRREFATARLRTLDVDRIEAGLDRIASGVYGRGWPLSKSSVARVRDVLVAVLDFGVKRKVIALNPARLAVVTPTAAEPQRRTALEAEEAEALWDALDGERLGPLFRVMLATGLRPGEALGLCWDSVDLDRGELTVRRAVRLERGRVLLTEELKTRSSYRTIAVPAPALAELRAQRAGVVAAKLASAVWVTGDPGLVFPTVTGRPWDPSNARDELARICADHGLPRVLPNELRHSCASILSDRGIPLELIADLLGHTSTRMLDQTYRHRPRRAVTAAVGVMDGLFGASSG